MRYKSRGILSPKRVQQIRESMLGEKNHRFGKKVSDETIDKIRRTKLGTNSGGEHRPKRHSEETKDKIRLARMNQVLPVTDTTIECIVKKYLDERGIEYSHPFNLGDRFQCDFFILSQNLIVECDGDYWHSRDDMKKRDAAKDAYARACGINMQRIKESDIRIGNFCIPCQT